MFGIHVVLRFGQLLQRVPFLNDGAKVAAFNGGGNPLHCLSGCLGCQQEPHTAVREKGCQHCGKPIGGERHHAPVRFEVVAVVPGDHAAAVNNRIERGHVRGIGQVFVVVHLNSPQVAA